MHSISSCFAQILKVFVLISIPLLSIQPVDGVRHGGDLIIVYKAPEHSTCEICDDYHAHDEVTGSESVQDTSAVSVSCKYCLHISNNH